MYVENRFYSRRICSLRKVTVCKPSKVVLERTRKENARDALMKVLLICVKSNKKTLSLTALFGEMTYS